MAGGCVDGTLLNSLGGRREMISRGWLAVCTRRRISASVGVRFGIRVRVLVRVGVRVRV